MQCCTTVKTCYQKVCKDSSWLCKLPHNHSACTVHGFVQVSAFSIVPSSNTANSVSVTHVHDACTHTHTNSTSPAIHSSYKTKHYEYPYLHCLCLTICENRTSSTKLEVHNVLQYHHSRMELWPQATCTENLVKFEHASRHSIYRQIQTRTNSSTFKNWLAKLLTTVDYSSSARGIITSVLTTISFRWTWVSRFHLASYALSVPDKNIWGLLEHVFLRAGYLSCHITASVKALKGTTHTQHNRFTALWNLSGKTRVSRYQKNIHPLLSS